MQDVKSVAKVAGKVTEREVATARTKPCPNPAKGKRCPLCGGEWVCLESWRPKANAAGG